jgi:hypothetical protein
VTRPNADQLTPDPSEGISANTHFLANPRAQWGRTHSFDAAESIASPDNADQYFHENVLGSQSKTPFPLNDQRTILFTNLSDKVTHSDLTGIIRGGRLLDIYVRNDRSATVSFVEGATEFFNYAKKKDIYLHTKRVHDHVHL